MDVRVRWVEDNTFLGFSQTNHWAVMDTPHESSDGAPTPMEYLLMALGGCTGIDVRSILEKMRQEVTSIELSVSGERAEEHPKVFTSIRVKFTVKGRGLDREKVERAVALSHEKYCSVGAMLGKACPITTEVDVLEG